MSALGSVFEGDANPAPGQSFLVRLVPNCRSSTLNFRRLDSLDTRVGRSGTGGTIWVASVTSGPSGSSAVFSGSASGASASEA